MALLREHPTGNGVGHTPIAVQFQVKEAGRVVERLAALEGNDEAHVAELRSAAPARVGRIIKRVSTA
jgi:hypothetical protein